MYTREYIECCQLAYQQSKKHKNKYCVIRTPKELYDFRCVPYDTFQTDKDILESDLVLIFDRGEVLSQDNRYYRKMPLVTIDPVFLDSLYAPRNPKNRVHTAYDQKGRVFIMWDYTDFPDLEPLMGGDTFNFNVSYDKLIPFDRRISDVLPLYEKPDHYFGAHYWGFYTLLGKTRDSNCLTRSNYTVALERLKESCNNASEYICTDSVTHWAVGWAETMRIAHNCPIELLEQAEEIYLELQNYPVLNDDHYSNLRWEEITEYWEGESGVGRQEIRQSAKEYYCAKRVNNRMAIDYLWETWEN